MKWWPFKRKPREYRDHVGDHYKQHIPQLLYDKELTTGKMSTWHEEHGNWNGLPWWFGNKDVEVPIPRKGDTITVLMDGWDGGYFATMTFTGEVEDKGEGLFAAAAVR